MWKEFRDFIARGSVMDLAVGVIIGAAFGRIVTSLVEGILMPPLGLLLGRVDFSSLFVVLDRSKGVPASLADAKMARGESLSEAEYEDWCAWIDPVEAATARPRRRRAAKPRDGR